MITLPFHRNYICGPSMYDVVKEYLHLELFGVNGEEGFSPEQNPSSIVALSIFVKSFAGPMEVTDEWFEHLILDFCQIFHYYGELVFEMQNDGRHEEALRLLRLVYNAHRELVGEYLGDILSREEYLETTWLAPMDQWVYLLQRRDYGFIVRELLYYLSISFATQTFEDYNLSALPTYVVNPEKHIVLREYENLHKFFLKSPIDILTDIRKKIAARKILRYLSKFGAQVIHEHLWRPGGPMSVKFAQMLE